MTSMLASPRCEGFARRQNDEDHGGGSLQNFKV